MLKNNNRNVISRLYRRMLKQNKLRNRVALLAIILTTLMFTAIFTMGFSMVKNINQMQLRTQGTKAFLFLEHPTEAQMKEIKSIPSLQAAGIRISVGELTDTKKEYTYSLEYYDRTEFEQNLSPTIQDICGTYPEKENEVMLSSVILNAVGIKSPKVGQSITFLQDEEKMTYVLSGWFTGYSTDHPVLVSEALTKKYGLTAENAGVVCLSAKSGKQEELLYAARDRVKLENGQEWAAGYDVQMENGRNRILIIGGMCMISLLIVASGWLLIYNVMYISVAKDIRFYGMLKTIGTSPSQIRSLVKKQTAHLACIGIPIGVLLGTAISFGVVPLAMRMLSSDGADEALSGDVNFNWGIYVFSVAFAAVTVWISVRKPAKIAGKVSPVEALRYQAGQKGNIRAPRAVRRLAREMENGRTRRKGKLVGMAFRNVFREKKRSFLVFASLFLGTMTFLCVNCFIKCMDVDSYLERYFANDYALYAAGRLSEDEKPNQAGDPLEVVAKKMEEMDGMKFVRLNRHAYVFLPFSEALYRPFLKDATGKDEEDYKRLVSLYQANDNSGVRYGAHVISMDRRQIEVYNRRAKQKIDPERFEKGEICIIGYLEKEEYAEELLGKILTIENKSTKEQKTVEVGSVMGGENSGLLNIYGISYQYGAPGDIIVSDAFFDSMFPDAQGYGVVADAKPGKDASLAPKVQALAKESPAVEIAMIKSVEGEETRKAFLGLTVVADLISGILILIGTINFINVMLTGVYTRKHEFAVLESIGMTKKQIKKMLVSEGAIYGIITVALVWTLGSVMVYGAGIVSMATADYGVFHFPFGLMAAVSAAILAICLIVPVPVFKEISESTVTERLREGAV